MLTSLIFVDANPLYRVLMEVSIGDFMKKGRVYAIGIEIAVFLLVCEIWRLFR